MSLKGRQSKTDKEKAKAVLPFLLASSQLMVESLVLISTLFIMITNFDRMSMREVPEIRKLINKRRPYRLSAPNMRFEPRSHYGKSNNNITRDGTNYTGRWYCGVTKEQFDQICVAVQSKSRLDQRPRDRYLSTSACVAVTLHYLRHATSRYELCDKYGIQKSCLDRTLEWTILHLRTCLEKLQEMGPVKGSSPLGAFQTSGSVDCCTHPRARVHPGEDSYYRGDKRFHFLTSQIVADHAGSIMRVTIAKGHNNDQGLYNISQMNDWLEKRGMEPLLADLGYTGSGIIAPIGSEAVLRSENPVASARINRLHSSQRVMIENVNSWFKNWKIADVKCRLTPEMQAIALVVCGMLTNLTSHQDGIRRARIMSDSV